MDVLVCIVLALRIPSLLSFFPLPFVSQPPNHPRDTQTQPYALRYTCRQDGTNEGMAMVLLDSQKTRESRASSHAAGNARPPVHPSSAA